MKSVISSRNVVYLMCTMTVLDEHLGMFVYGYHIIYEFDYQTD